ncbi:MAG: S9 family peptidase [Phycisphaeraceae bacterium]|nr:S9 family peptidase [Phycisphaeraceae bacterium]
MTAAPLLAADDTLIPRDVLFGNPDKASPSLSPDGQRLAFLAPVDDVLNIWVAPADSPSAAVPVTNDTDRGIRTYFWSYDNVHVLYLQDKGGDENWRVYSTNVATHETIDLTPMDGVAAQIQQVSDKFPGEILIGINDRVPQFHDIYRVNIGTGDRALVQENNGYLGYVTDDDYNVRFATRFTDDGGSELFRNDDSEFTPFLKIPMEDSLTTNPMGFDRSGDILYFIDSRGRNTAALTTLDLQTGEQAVIADDAHADLSDVMVHPTKKNIEAVAFTRLRKDWVIVDDALKPDFAYLRKIADGDIEVISRTHDDTKWVVAYLLDDGPVQYYLYDRPARTAKFLFTNRSQLEGLPLSKMRPVAIPSRDGYDLVSYLTLPRNTELVGDHPRSPLPMVLFVHGGPWARDNWGYHPYHQWLANRGYAVLSVNYRGSTGLGKDFLNAGNKEWAGRMHDDLIDAVNWAVDHQFADPNRVGIMGGSYGGYATLVGLTFTPDEFACGVDIVGPSNIVTLLNTIPPYWAPAVEIFKKRVGDHTTPEGQAFLEARSPLSRVDQISKPLLIAQGANDPRVKQTESDQIVEAMQRKGIPVTYVLYPDEGHGFRRPENSTSFTAVAEAFLAEHLGGRYEPIGRDFDGSTITVPVGADEIPGLAGALTR